MLKVKHMLCITVIYVGFYVVGVGDRGYVISYVTGVYIQLYDARKLTTKAK